MAKIKVLPVEPEHRHVFKCKKCGNGLGTRLGLTAHKFGGPGLGAPTIAVCENCRGGDDFIF